MKNILISDLSLRVVTGGTLSFKEKLEVAKSLSELGVDILELSIFTGDKADEVFVKTVCSCITKSIISSDCGKSVDNVKRAYQAILSAKKKRLIISLPVSPTQMEYSLGKKPVAIMGLLNDMSKEACSLCDDVEVSLEDATRAEPDFLYSAINSALDCGVKTICLSDISGAFMPDEFADFINKVYENCPKLKSNHLSIAVSDDFSLAVSCLISSIKCGADLIKISSLKLMKLPKVSKVLPAIDFVGSKYGFVCSIDKTKQKKISSKISQITAEKYADVSVSELKENSTELSPNLSEDEIISIIKKMGYDLSYEDNKKIYLDYLKLASKKKVTSHELNVIVATNAMQVPETYSLVSYSVQSSNILTATASIVLTKNNEKVNGLSYGNGSVDAAFLALETICGRHFEVDDFELGAVTEGKEAMGQALVRLRANGKVYSGRGVSTDIVGASIKAYLSALNKIVYEENN